MNYHVYQVWFGPSQFEVVAAFNEKEATILAQAERIKNGLDYEVVQIVNMDEI